MANPVRTIEAYQRDRHDRSEFDCGVPTLNDWLATRVSQFEKKNLARTYVWVEQRNVIVRGYYALSSHSVAFDSLPDDQARGLPKMDVPVVLLGRLAVDVTVQGQKLGEFLLIDALRRAEQLSQTIGVRAVEVDAIDRRAKQFYGRYGFVELRDDPHHLFLPIHLVRKLNLPPFQG